MKILLIESDGDLARRLSAALASRGLEAVHSPDGRDAVEVARQEGPAAIVLCVELPGMSGYSLCKRFRQDPALRATPLVITSGEATPETFEQHRRLKTRADGYLMKPFKPAALLDLLGGLVPLPPAAGEPSPGSEGETLELEIDPTGASELGSSSDDDLRLIDEAFERVAPAEHGLGHGLEPTQFASATPGREPEPELELEVEVPPAGDDRAAPPGVEVAEGATAQGLEHGLERLHAEADQALDALGVAAPAEHPALDLGAAAAMLDTGLGAGAEPAPGQGEQDRDAARVRDLEQRLRDLEQRLRAAEQRAGEAERARAEAEERAREALSRLSELEAASARNEERVLRASRRLRGDELAREKVRKALAIALQLLEERDGAGAPERGGGAAAEELSRRRE